MPDHPSSPDRAQLRAHRKIFWDAWQRELRGEPLDALQVRIVRVIRAHPEYHAMFDDEEHFVDRDIVGEGTSFYVHLSLHLAIEEQLALRQPTELVQWMEVALTQRGMTRHEAIHAALEVLGHIMDQARQRGGEPDGMAYVQGLRRLIQS